ncbi:hypothetical protein [Azohydromonas aeria]|uniref:hypothetical protein n=1 Tax=Azohydromonas aeria TaxID=2590212 RepID=UPI0012FB813C|nr:hypothetical protein [Azohydromonas aeria]
MLGVGSLAQYPLGAEALATTQSAVAAVSAAVSVAGVQSAILSGYVGSASSVMPKRVRLILRTLGGQPAANLAGLSVAFFDQPEVILLQAPSVVVTGVATDAGGMLDIDVGASTLSPGEIGYLVEGNASGDPSQDHSGWHGPVTVEAA